VAFRITRLIFALGIGHVFRFSLDLRTGRAGAFAVRIDISDMHDETGTPCLLRAANQCRALP
jgi:hypothetical protein